MKKIILTVFALIIGIGFAAQVFACPFHKSKPSADTETALPAGHP